MASAIELRKSAHEAYINGNHRHAVMLFRQAAEQAREHNDEAGWFKEMVWAAEAYRAMGNLQDSLGLLLMARAEEPPGDKYEHWLCREMQLIIKLDVEPIRSKLEAMLVELAHRRQFPQDLHVLRGQLSLARGQWAEAITHLERGFASFRDDEPGYNRPYIAHLAAKACLAERRLSAAEDWIQAIDNMSDRREGLDKAIRTRQASDRLSLARVRCAPFSELRSRFRECVDISRGVEQACVEDYLCKNRTRIWLLDPDGGDPARPTHQSRISRRDYPVYRWNCNSRFHHTLLVVDYRLACLRFAVGLGPVDDEFDKTPPSLVKVTPPNRRDFGQRLDKAGVALRRARECAAHLDTMLECDWRTKEVDARAIWIRAIGAAAAPG